jgi:hypothetical protein
MSCTLAPAVAACGGAGGAAPTLPMSGGRRSERNLTGPKLEYRNSQLQLKPLTKLARTVLSGKYSTKPLNVLNFTENAFGSWAPVLLPFKRKLKIKVSSFKKL